MKYITRQSMILAAFFMPVLLWAEELVEVPLESFLLELVVKLGGLKGMGVMASVLVGVQLVMMALKTRLGHYAGKYRLVAVYMLTVASSLIALKSSGQDWVSASLHANTLAAFQVFGNQVYKQFITKKD